MVKLQKSNSDFCAEVTISQRRKNIYICGELSPVSLGKLLITTSRHFGEITFYMFGCFLAHPV